MSIIDHVANMEQIYQSVLAKAQKIMKKVQTTELKYYNMHTFNNPFSKGDKLVK